MTINVNEQEVCEKPQYDDVVLSVKGVSKKFCRDLKRSLLYGVQDIATEIVGIREKNDRLRPKEFWALKDVSFQLRRGESLGLVGPNGSGKTTLLRIISGLIKPDSGSVEIQGRVAPLIALGAGFNLILTGRENIYANMSILGLSKKEIDQRFQDVVDFAEIGDAIDAPVQSYSSGMAARLGFACAIYTEPDILLIDEVLAVGDIKFQAKCHRRLSELRQKGTSFILVSHNPQVILGICDSSVYLWKGKWVMFGDTDSVITRYEKDLFMTEDKSLGVMVKKKSAESLGLDIVSLSFKDERGNIIESLVSGEPANLCVECRAHKTVSDIVLRIIVYEISGGGNIVQFMSNVNDRELLEMPRGNHEVIVQMPYLCFKPGFYNMKIIIRESSLYTLDYVESFRFKVETNGSMSICAFYQPRSWKVVSKLV